MEWFLLIFLKYTFERQQRPSFRTSAKWIARGLFFKTSTLMVAFLPNWLSYLQKKFWLGYRVSHIFSVTLQFSKAQWRKPWYQQRFWPQTIGQPLGFGSLCNLYCKLKYEVAPSVEQLNWLKLQISKSYFSNELCSNVFYEHIGVSRATNVVLKIVLGFDLKKSNRNTIIVYPCWYSLIDDTGHS